MDHRPIAGISDAAARTYLVEGPRHAPVSRLAVETNAGPNGRLGHRRSDSHTTGRVQAEPALPSGAMRIATFAAAAVAALLALSARGSTTKYVAGSPQAIAQAKKGLNDPREAHRVPAG
jgi:hypothetical protein